MERACRYRAGLVLIIIVIAMWVTSCEVTQGLFEEYEHPFAVTYLGTSFLALHLPIAFLKIWLTNLLKNRHSDNSSSTTNTGGESSHTTCCDPNADHNASSSSSSSTEMDDHRISINSNHPHPYPEQLSRDRGGPPSLETQEEVAKALNTRSIALLATYITPIWFSTEYFSNAALARTTVASTTTLVSTSGLFTLFIGAAMGVETVTTAKVISVLVSMTGIAMTTFGKTWAPTNTSLNGKRALMGDFFALLSAIAYGLFTVLLKKYAGEEGRKVDVQKLYGFIGLFTLVTLWWLVWPLTAVGLEHKLTFPSSAKTVEILFANCFIGSFLPDYLLALGIVWTAPLISALGMSLTIPLAMIEDIILHKNSYSVVYILGSAMVFSGFLTADFSDWLSKNFGSKLRN